MALSQVNRALEQRSGVGSKRPMLSDLRESGAIDKTLILSHLYTDLNTTKYRNGKMVKVVWVKLK